MKNIFKLIGLIALAAVLGLAACDEDGNGDGKIVISGTIQAASSANISFARTVISQDAKTFTGEVNNDDDSISGILRDGDMIFMLTGMYDRSTGGFSMQAASSFAVFSINGALDLSGNIIPALSQAVIQIRDNEGEWSTIVLDVVQSSGAAGGVEDVNQEDGAKTPVWARGIWYDSFTMYIITENAIMVHYGDDWEQIIIVEIEDVFGDPNAVNLIVRDYIVDASGNPDYFYTAKFYVTKDYNQTVQDVIGDLTFDDVYGTEDDKKLSEAIEEILETGAKVLFLSPYVGTGSDVFLEDELTVEGIWSPLFKTTSSAIAASEIKVVPFLTMMLTDTETAVYKPPVNEIEINVPANLMFSTNPQNIQVTIMPEGSIVNDMIMNYDSVIAQGASWEMTVVGNKITTPLYISNMTMFAPWKGGGVYDVFVSFNSDDPMDTMAATRYLKAESVTIISEGKTIVNSNDLEEVFYLQWYDLTNILEITVSDEIMDFAKNEYYIHDGENWISGYNYSLFVVEPATTPREVYDYRPHDPDHVNNNIITRNEYMPHSSSSYEDGVLTQPLLPAYGSEFMWTGTGNYDVYLLLRNFSNEDPVRFYKVSGVTFTDRITEITISEAGRVTPFSAGGNVLVITVVDGMTFDANTTVRVYPAGTSVRGSIDKLTVNLIAERYIPGVIIEGTTITIPLLERNSPFAWTESGVFDVILTTGPNDAQNMSLTSLYNQPRRYKADSVNIAPGTNTNVTGFYRISSYAGGTKIIEMDVPSELDGLSYSFSGISLLPEGTTKTKITDDEIAGGYNSVRPYFTNSDSLGAINTAYCSYNGKNPGGKYIFPIVHPQNGAYYSPNQYQFNPWRGGGVYDIFITFNVASEQRHFRVSSVEFIDANEYPTFDDGRYFIEDIRITKDQMDAIEVLKWWEFGKSFEINIPKSIYDVAKDSIWIYLFEEGDPGPLTAPYGNFDSNITRLQSPHPMETPEGWYFSNTTADPVTLTAYFKAGYKEPWAVSGTYDFYIQCHQQGVGYILELRAASVSFANDHTVITNAVPFDRQ
ncbi:MAG: hypothetical protein FWD26_03675 [Treponema sp.]|nr:hypothetical protein [Treponema sp.]